MVELTLEEREKKTKAVLGSKLGPGVYVTVDEEDPAVLLFVTAKGKAIGFQAGNEVEIADGWLEYEFIPLDREVTLTFGPKDIGI